MKNLTRGILALALILVISGFAFAGEVNGPPCVPGEVNTPPCSSAPASTDPSETNGPPAPSAESGLSFRDLVLDVAECALLLF